MDLNLLEALVRQQETRATYELLGVHISFKDITEHEISKAGLDLEQAYLLVTKAILYKYGVISSEIKIGNYIASYYTDMFAQLSDLSKEITYKNFESRQFVIDFPKEHCFQTIQILVRGNEINIITNMRSCNLKNNFLMDTFLSYYCGRYMRFALERNGIPINAINVIMNIGSLHIFKEKAGISNVL